VQLIIAEKPSVARDLARALGVRPSGQGCFEGDGRVITWCVGHLVELDEPSAYDHRWKAWRLDTLPMLPDEFKLRPAKHAGEQLARVAALLRDRRFDSVVNACDAGREGELIFRYVVQYAGRSPPAFRLWVSSLTDEAIQRGFQALRPALQLEPLADAARSRSEADWLVGLNATRAITVKLRGSGGDALYSIGRVQTPTLAMLVAREKAIRAFVPQDYWELEASFTAEGGATFKARWTRGRASQLGTSAIAAALVARCAAHARHEDPLGPRVESVHGTTVREAPPALFDLTSLQRTANRRFGFSAQRTLDLAQALYEKHKLLTYPRTDSRHLTTDVAKDLPQLFTSLARVPEYATFAAPLCAAPPRPSKRIVDDSKVADHHAIIPTGKPIRLDALAEDERRIVDLVVRRFLGAFYPDAEFAETEAIVRVGGPGRYPAERGKLERDADGQVHKPPPLAELPPPPDWYVARGRIRLAPGWQEVAGIEPREDRDADAPALLPPLQEGQALDGAFVSKAKKTLPPRRYNEASLLSAMESAGKTLTDEELRAAMKDTGLGTPATRAAIIETLLKRGYAERQQKNIVATATGEALIDHLPVQSLASPELTGAWEARLARIARGEESRPSFMADIAAYVRETIDAIRAASVAELPAPARVAQTARAPQTARPAQTVRPPVAVAAVTTNASVVGRCLRCGGEVRTGARAFACAAGCGFAIAKDVAGRPIDAELASVLLARRRSVVLQGFRSQAGPPFDAALVLEDDGRLRFASQEEAAPAAVPAPAQVSDLPCPRCREGRLVTGKRGWGCARWRSGCAFVVWFETAGRTLSEAQLRDLILRGKTRRARFPTGDGHLVLDPAGEGGTRFVPLAGSERP